LKADPQPQKKENAHWQNRKRNGTEGKPAVCRRERDAVREPKVLKKTYSSGGSRCHSRTETTQTFRNKKYKVPDRKMSHADKLQV